MAVSGFRKSCLISLVATVPLYMGTGDSDQVHMLGQLVLLPGEPSPWPLYLFSKWSFVSYCYVYMEDN